MKIERKETVTRKCSVSLTGTDIVDLLNQELAARGATRISGDAQDLHIMVSVPGGGDWASTDLEICYACPVNISWTETEEST